jgi:hypothetical protein
MLNRRNREPKYEIQPGDSALVKRLKKFGTRGMIIVHSSEGAPVSPEAVKYLVPAGSDPIEDEPKTDN